MGDDKFVILFHLFGGNVRRFSELRRAIPAVSEEMLIQPAGESSVADRRSDGVDAPTHRSSRCFRSR
jgi:hypothetical protein